MEDFKAFLSLLNIQRAIDDTLFKNLLENLIMTTFITSSGVVLWFVKQW
jgi:hypothetical protein